MTDTTAAGGSERLSLLRVLGPGHVWALGVGIVLVGEYMGWNFSVGKGGMIAGLVACWVAGLLYTCVAMIDSEVTSTVAAAGGQYAQAKHIVGPLMAFNVGLFLVMAEKSSGTADAPNWTARNRMMMATKATAVMTKLKVSVASTPR